MAKRKAAGAAKSAGKSRTKSEVYREIAQDTGLARKQVESVFNSMTGIIKRDLSGRGPGLFTVPGLMKIKVQKKPATKARTVPSPFNPGQMMTIKAKPARKVVKVQALKALKAMV